jgi:hypothetical protein
MTEVLYVDYSWTVPPAAAIKAAGYSGVLRYLSPDSSKNLKNVERDSLLAAGLGIGLVWESSSGRAGQGYAAGVADGTEATRQAKALGYPVGCPLFFAVDSGALSASKVAPYFAGARTTSGYPVGVYGSGSVVDATAGYKWQTSAWSAGYVSPHSHFYQRQHTTVAHPISGTDENVRMNQIPVWSKILVPPPVPKPTPAPLPTHNVHQTMLVQLAVRIAPDGSWGAITQSATAAVIRRDLNHVAYLQMRVGAKPDGMWGPLSEAARVTTLSHLQAAVGVTPDGVWGPKSVAAWAVAVSNNYGK